MMTIHYVMLISLIVLIFLAIVYSKLGVYSNWVPVCVIGEIISAIVLVSSLMISFLVPMKYSYIKPKQISITKAKNEIIVETSEGTFHLTRLSDLDILKAKPESIKIKKEFNSYGIELSNHQTIVYE